MVNQEDSEKDTQGEDIQKRLLGLAAMMFLERAISWSWEQEGRSKIETD